MQGRTVLSLGSITVIEPEFLGFFVPLCLLCGVLAVIDARHGIIPDWLNLAIAGFGLWRAIIVDGFPDGLQALAEGIVIGAIFWLLRRLYFSFREIQGLGLGDVKFLAAAGLWIGITGLPLLLLVATLTALAAAAVLQLTGRSMTRQSSISFGPFLALGLVVALVVQQYQA
jgi:leader peptidase (prepilin peptidase) / N-methyltransferase